MYPHVSQIRSRSVQQFGRLQVINKHTQKISIGEGIRPSKPYLVNLYGGVSGRKVSLSSMLQLYNIMYNDCETLTRAWATEYFYGRVGLHQGSALSSLLFILIMDVLQAELGKELPWVILFTDDLVICAHSKAEVVLQLGRWRETFPF